MLLERWGGILAVTDVTRVIAIGELSCQFSQIALPDRLVTQRTASLLAGRPAIYDDEFHVPRPNVTRCNKAIAAPRDIDNEPIPITSVTQAAAQCRNMDGEVGWLDKCVRPNPSH
jgi:hypothetical protein